MRWFAAATVSLSLVGSVYGCSAPSDGAIPVDQGGAPNGTAGVSATAGTGAATSAGSSGSPMATAGGNSVGDAGSSGATVSGGGDAGSGGDASLAGGSNGGAGTPGGGTGGAAQGGSGGAALTIPNAPTSLVLQVASSTSIQLSWTDNSTDESGFNVYWSTTADKPAQPNLMVATDVTTALADTLTAQTPYYFWVESYNGAGSSADATGTATPVPVPAQPTGLVVTG
ncbi:MAG TPA: fibronectin type III domain-containing protein, partial [Polyangiaceae bacterium]